MKPFPRQLCLSLLLPLLVLPAACGLWTMARPSSSRADDPPAAETQVTLLYTVNNAGYTDVCG